MAGKNRSIAGNAVVIGVLTAVSSAILFILVLQNLWWNLQESFGHAMFHRLEDIVRGAEYMQGLSLLIVLPLVAGALTAWFSRAAIESEKTAARAGGLTGLVIACTFSISAMILFVCVAAGMPDFNLWYLVTNLPFILAVSFVFPAIVIVPSTAAGAWVLKRNLSNVEGTAPPFMSRGKAVLAAVVASVVLVSLMVALISRNYDLGPITPALLFDPVSAHVAFAGGRDVCTP